VARKAARKSSRKRRARATRLAPIDAAKVFDPGGALVETYQEAVAAAIPASVEIPETFWDELRTRFGLFLQIHERRLRASPSRQRWERIAPLVEELASEMRSFRRTTPWSYYDPLWPNRALAGLWEIKVKCDAHLAYYRIVAEAFSRGRDPHREYLYQSVLDLWGGLRRQIGYSSGASRSGPLLRFFRACLEPLLGEFPDETIRSIIRRRLGYRVKRPRKK
jgi:hypothetical protein